MHNKNIPDYAELPSTSKLIKSTIIAVITAIIILVTIVLPSEYGIDPTGLGKITGLKRMGEIKTTLAKELQADLQADLNAGLDAEPNTNPADQTQPTPTSQSRTDTLTVTLAPSESTEIKITMIKDTKVEFQWTSTPDAAFFDLHGDSKEINYHIYEKGTDSTKQGTLTAAFTGNHGWYWKNRSNNPISITLTATGAYSAIKEMN